MPRFKSKTVSNIINKLSTAFSFEVSKPGLFAFYSRGHQPLFCTPYLDALRWAAMRGPQTPLGSALLSNTSQGPARACQQSSSAKIELPGHKSVHGMKLPFVGPPWLGLGWRFAPSSQVLLLRLVANPVSVTRPWTHQPPLADGSYSRK